MFILFLATLAYADETPDFTLAQLPCAQAQTPVLTVDTAKVPWPFKAKAAKLVLAAKAQADAHTEKCTELLTAAHHTAAQDEAAGMIGTVAVAGGKDVSFDGRKAIVVTGNAATAHELPGFYGGARLGGYGQQGSDYTTVGNLAFLAGQQTPVAVVSGTGTAKAKSSAKAAPKVDPAEAEKARAAAAAKAEAERKARAAAAKAAAAKAEAGS